MTTINDLNNKITILFEEYKDDVIILNKLIHHINNELPNLLSNTKKLQISRDNRKQLLQDAHDKFVKEFISKNIYFYSNTSEIFFNIIMRIIKLLKKMILYIIFFLHLIIMIIKMK